MERDHDIKPGSIFCVKERIWLSICTADIDNEKVVTTRPTRGYMQQCKVEVDEHIMFLDVVYDPYMKKHLLRFLYGSKMVALTHQKGRTLKEIKQCMTLVPIQHSIGVPLVVETPDA